MHEGIGNTKLLKGLAPEILNFLESEASCSFFDKDSFVALEGSLAHSLYVIKSGAARLQTSVQNGAEARIVSYLHPGDALGFSFLVAPYVFGHDAFCTENLEVYVVSGHKIRLFCEANPSLGYSLVMRFLKNMIHRNADFRSYLDHQDSIIKTELIKLY